MRPARIRSIDIRRVLIHALVLVTYLSVVGCVTPRYGVVAASSEPPFRVDAAPDRVVPVSRYGRYTLAELTPAAAQQDLLLQIVDVVLPDGVQASVGDAVRHVLLRSGYRLCDGHESEALNVLPLPAAHYRLGPLTLRDALLTLVGSGWSLQIDDIARQVCVAAVAPPPLISIPARATDEVSQP
jgi:conjugative transfer region protein (TIGR03748 family)